VLVLASIWMPSAGAAPATVEVKVGIPLSLTGAVAFAGTKMRKAMELAVDEVNRRAFLGSMRINAIWQDDQSDQSQAIDVTRRLALRDRVHTIVGYVASNICKAALPVANELKVPTLNADCVAPDLEKIGPYIFRSVVPYNPFVEQMIATLAKDRGWKRGAVIFVQDNDALVSVSRTIQEAYRKNGIEVVGVEAVPRSSDTDFSAQLTKIAAQRPDVLAIMLIGGQSGPAIVQARQAGMTQTNFIGEQNLNSAEVLRIAGKAAAGSYFPAHWYLRSENPRNLLYVSAYRTRYHEDPDVFATNGYTGVWVLAHALKAAGKPDREAIRAALDSLREVPTVFGNGKLRMHDRAVELEAIILTVTEDGQVVPYRSK